MNVNIGHVHIHIHMLHIMHFARINSSPGSPVFVLPKYTFPLVNLYLKSHHGLGQAKVRNRQWFLGHGPSFWFGCPRSCPLDSKLRWLLLVYSVRNDGTFASPSPCTQTWTNNLAVCEGTARLP
jgi:hypothetical protein